MVCCDITNAQFGVSKETALEGGNLPVHRSIACHLVVVVTNYSQVTSHHTSPPLGGAGLSSHFNLVPPGGAGLGNHFNIFTIFTMINNI